MSTFKRFFLALALLLMASAPMFAQTPVISFDENVGKWALGLAEPNVNVIGIADNFTDVVEGNGSMEVTVALRHHAFSWGTWTDFQYTFPSPGADFKDADEVRFWLKILDRPTNRRGLQFTCDFYDQPAGATGSELWRYYNGLGDRDILYNANTDWYEVVIPFSRLTKPSWATTFNDKFDPSAVIVFGFGVHGDSSATDSVRFLIDNLQVSKSRRVAPVLSFDENVGKWAVSLAEPLLNRATINDNFTDVVEGNGAMEVAAALRHYAFPWGTWTDFRYDFPAPGVDLSGATEFRFNMKILTPPSNVKSLQFTCDFFDQPAGATGGELFRWPAQYGLFYGPNQTGWVEVAVPFKDLATPVWATVFNGQLDLNAVVSFAFGVHGDSTAADSLVFLFDDLRATAGDVVSTAVQDRPNLHVPSVFSLGQNYPNPFNPTTNIDFTLPETGITSLKIYDLNGKLVQTVFENANKLRGSYSFNVDMNRHPSGIYFYTLEQGSTRLTKKMTFMK